MNVIGFVKRYAQEIDGQFTDYDHKTAVIIMPLTDGRFQTVLATSKPSAASGKELAIFSSRVCEYNPQIDLSRLMERNAQLDYSRFVLDGGFLKVQASVFADVVQEAHVKEMLTEIANVADEFELVLTGLDVH